MSEETWVRAENVSVRCGECDHINEIEVLEAPADETWETIVCPCGADYTVKLSAEV